MLEQNKIDRDLIEQAGCPQCQYFLGYYEGDIYVNCPFYYDAPPGINCPNWKQREPCYFQYLPEEEPCYFNWKDISDWLILVNFVLGLLLLVLALYASSSSSMPEWILAFLRWFVVKTEIFSFIFVGFRFILLIFYPWERDLNDPLLIFATLILMVGIVAQVAIQRFG